MIPFGSKGLAVDALDPHMPRMSFIQQSIQRHVYQLVGFGSGEIDLDRPQGDAGLFGPKSVAWSVHGDFTSMMVGGVSALLLQMLHPGALAGVWDHSNFRHDMLGRLRRTAQFIAGTTYGSTAQAERLIERVRTVHGHVHGTLPNGAPYSAHDPDLLTWVHVAEVTSFLGAHRRYRDPALSAADQDRYFAETASIAQRLGATSVPTTRRDIDRYLREIHPRLRCDARTREVARALLSQPASTVLAGPFQHVMMAAGIELLPDWAAAMHGLRLGDPRRVMVRAGVQGVGTVLRWALRDGSARRARRRVEIASA